MNFDGRLSSFEWKPHDVDLSHSRRKIAQKTGESKEGFGLPLSERVSIWIEIEMTSKSEARRGQSVPFLGHLLGEILLFFILLS